MVSVWNISVAFELTEGPYMALGKKERHYYTGDTGVPVVSTIKPYLSLITPNSFINSPQRSSHWVLHHEIALNTQKAHYQ